jgi:ubiquinone/menaquinone biosynthesis C-methylase UbiE
MENHAYDAMENLQTQHWWWRGLRKVYTNSISSLNSSEEFRQVIDIGCGYGANFSVFNNIGAVVGVDLKFDTLRGIQRRPALGLVQACADALPFQDNIFDVVGLLGVIEHVKFDSLAIQESYRVAKPNAILLLLTSAFMILWSHHDVANNHARRYRLRQIKNSLKRTGWTILRLSYINSLIFPAVLVTRLIQRVIQSPDEIYYDMGPSIKPINRILEAILFIEGAIIINWRWCLPFGVNILGVAQRIE